MLKFKINHCEDMEFKKHWYWHVEKPEIPGPSYTRKSDCRRGLLQFIADIRHHRFEIDEVKE